MDVVKIYRDDPAYPSSLKKYFANSTPNALSAIGNLGILQGKSLAIFSSIKCPGDIIIKTYDLMCQLRNDGHRWCEATKELIGKKLKIGVFVFL